MKNTLTYLIIFLFLSINLKADDLIEGHVYEGTLSNVFSSSLNITLPPGKWTIDDITQIKTWYKVYLLNHENEGRLKLRFPVSKSLSGGYLGGGIKKCRNGKLSKFYQVPRREDRSYNIIVDGIKRGGIQTKFCIQEVTWQQTNVPQISGKHKVELNIQLKIQKQSGAPIFFINYDLFYPINRSNISSINTKELKRIGVQLVEGLKDNSKGHSADFSDINMLIKTPSKNNNSVSSSSTSPNVNKYDNQISNFNEMILETAADNFVCQKSSSLDGMKWENMDSKFGDYVTEAFRRNLSLKECRRLTGRKPSDVKKSTEPVISMDIKNRLKELKSMLDDGLINQDQYDAKSTELLKDF